MPLSMRRRTGKVVVRSGTSLVCDRQLAGAQCHCNNCAEAVEYIREVHKFFPRHGLRSWVEDPVASGHAGADATICRLGVGVEKQIRQIYLDLPRC